MSTRQLCALMTVGALPLLAACGGGGEAPRTQPSAPAASAPAAAAPAAAGTASIAGKIGFEGTPPAPEKIKMTTEAKCAAQHGPGAERQTIKVKDGGLADVVVYVKNAPAGSHAAPTEPALIDQKGCMYYPYVLTVHVNQPITIRNSDEVAHNIHPMPKVNEPFNFSQPKPRDDTRTFDKAEVGIPVSCDVHPWMRAYVSVFEHPFHAVTKEDGTYEIKGLPAGEYEVEAWHPKLKTVSGKVTVKDGEAAKLDLGYQG
jgi:hypothetical protein